MRVGRVVEFREEGLGIYSMPFYSARSCRSLVKRAREADGWRQAKIGDRAPDGSRVTVLDEQYRAASVLFLPAGTPLRELLDARLRAVVKPFVRSVWRLELERFVGTQLVRYGPGGHYQLHSDAGGDKQNRYFSVICYLNDDFDGGKTSFPAFNYSATPRRGQALVFPSKYLHRAEPVTRGEKLVLVSWLTGPAPVRWI